MFCFDRYFYEPHFRGIFFMTIPRFFFCRNLTDFCLEKRLQGELIDDFLISNFEDYCMIPMKYDILRQRTIMMRVI